jgi:hypothetical protein
MIAAWQQKAGAPATGFVSATQRDQLLRSAAAAVSKYDDEQKKLEDDKKKAEEEAKKKAEDEAKRKIEEEARSKGVAAATPAPSTAAADGTSEGTWQGTYTCERGPNLGAAPFSIGITVQIKNGRGTTSASAGSDTLAVAVRIDGNAVRITRDHTASSTSSKSISSAVLIGTLAGNTIRSEGRETISGRNCTVLLTKK